MAGRTAVEYTGMLLVVALVIAAITSSGVAQTIADACNARSAAFRAIRPASTDGRPTIRVLRPVAAVPEAPSRPVREDEEALAGD